MPHISQTEQDQIDDQLSQAPSMTRRATVGAAEDVLFKPLPLLDHGFVRLIDYMGDDSAIVQAARVSYGKGTRKTSHDRGLIRYLMRHRHTTPFEMCEIKLHVKMPIFVARQWIRHRTANVNEYSARYSILDKEFYIPDETQLAAQSTANHQGRGAVLEGDEARRVLDLLKQHSLTSYDTYETLLNERDGERLNENDSGLARELARMGLPTNYYTQWYWKTDLHNLLHFLSLRADPHAQYEIRVYAQAILDQIVKPWVPLAYEAYQDFIEGSMMMSRQMLGVTKDIFAKANLTEADWDKLQEDSTMSAREFNEFRAAVLGPHDGTKVIS